MSRLTIDISEKQHQALKAMAALKGKTIKQFTLEKLFSEHHEQLSAENESDLVWNTFVAEMEKRASEAVSGQVSERSPEDILARVLMEKSGS
jgi:uncharacterized protein (DUF1778 family)